MYSFCRLIRIESNNNESFGRNVTLTVRPSVRLSVLLSVKSTDVLTSFKQLARINGGNNKSKSTAGAVRVEANLPGISAACAIFNSKWHKKKYLTLKINYGYSNICILQALPK